MGQSRLEAGQQIQLADGRFITVIDKLGEGGQGIVYRVRLDDTGKEKALKWYYIAKLNNPQKFYDHLKRNIVSGSPSQMFVWPEQLTLPNDEDGSFGYVIFVFPNALT